MAFFVIASLHISCKYAKAPEGERLFLFFDNLFFQLLAAGSGFMLEIVTE
jgi:hypothetical protein